jgi:hypothetical protein
VAYERTVSCLALAIAACLTYGSASAGDMLGLYAGGRYSQVFGRSLYSVPSSLTPTSVIRVPRRVLRAGSVLRIERRFEQGRRQRSASFMRQFRYISLMCTQKLAWHV